MDQKELTDFVLKVARMRHMQKEYFRTKRGDVLVEACLLENEVDKFIDNYQQYKLF